MISFSFDDDYSLPNNTPLLICPFCSKNIPQLSFQGSDKQINVYLRCSCLQGDKFTSLNDLLSKINTPHKPVHFCSSHYQSADKYCAKCSLWLCSFCLNYHSAFANKHSLIDYELNIHCLLHEKAFKYYCEQCRVNLCINCKSNQHQSHKVIKLIKADFELNEMKIIDSLMDNNKHKTDTLLKRIDKEVNKLLAMRKGIQMAFKINDEINQSYRELYQSVCYTSLTLQHYPLYQLMQLRQSIMISNAKQPEEGPNIEDTFMKLNEYLRKSHVLVQTITNECKATLTGHSSYVCCLCQLSDGRLVSGSNDVSMKLWEPKTFQCTTTLLGHDDYVCCLYQLNDSQLASGSSDKAIKLWNSTTLRCNSTLIGHNDYVNSIAQLDNGDIVSCSDDMTIKIWNTVTQLCLTTLTGHSNSVLCLVQLNDGRLASGSRDKTIKLWGNNESLVTLTGHSNIVSCLVLLIDGRLASGSLDKSIKIWDPSTHKCVATLIGHNNFVSCLVQLYDGRLASGSWDMTIKSWSTTTNGCKSTLTGHSNNISCIIQLHDGRLASGCDDETIKFWST